jgi:hypothetical protein
MRTTKNGKLAYLLWTGDPAFNAREYYISVNEAKILLENGAEGFAI